MERVSIAAALLLFTVTLVGRRPSTAVIALVISTFFAIPFYVFSSGLNSGVFVSDAVLLGALMRWGASASANRRRFKAPPGSGVFLVLLLLVVASRVVVLGQEQDVMSFYHLGFFTLRFSAFALTYVLVGSLDIGPVGLRKLTTWICLLVIGVGVANILTHFGVSGLNFFSRELIGGREAAISAEQRAHAYLLGFNRGSVGLLAFTGLVFLFLRSLIGKIGAKFFTYVGLAIVGLLLLDSFSRAAVLAMIVAVVTLILRLRVKHTATITVAVLIGGGAILLVAGDVGLWTERLTGLFSREAFARSSGGGRVEDWMRLLNHLAQNPAHAVLGVGFYRYAHYRDFVTLYGAGHNQYIHTLGELGVMGLTTCLLLWATILRALDRLARSAAAASTQRMVGTVGFAFFLGLLASGLSQETLYPNPSMYNVSTLLMILTSATLAAYRVGAPTRALQAFSGERATPGIGTGFPFHARG